MFSLLSLYWDDLKETLSAKLEVAMFVWKANALCCCLDLVESSNVDGLNKVFVGFDLLLELID
jgi:hypothetical protein